MKLNNHSHIIYLLLVIFFIFWACTPKFSYNVKTFLFDGVPDPYMVKVTLIKDSTVMGVGSKVEKLKTKPVNEYRINLHEPYKKKECSKCHDRDFMNTTRVTLPELCYECHENFSKRYKVLHGPVASGDCTECHNPHQSKFNNLLMWSGQDICLHCHEMERIFMDKNHKEINDTSCTECHSPHGGDNISLLLTNK